MTRPGALLALLLVAPVLAGCLGGDVGGDPDRTSDLTHLRPADADTIATLEDGRVAFTWEAVPVGQGASAPLIGAVDPVSETTSITFPVDNRVGIIHASVQPTGDVQAFLLDHTDRLQCGLSAPEDGQGNCTGHVASGSGLEDGDDWQVQLTSVTTSAAEGTASVRVVLHPVEHLDAIWAAADAPLEEQLDPDGPGFEPVQIAEDGGEPTMGILADGTLFYTSASLVETTGSHEAYVMRSTDDGRTWEDVTPALNGRLTLDPMMHADPWTGRVFTDQLTVACSNLAWSDDAGETWIESPVACGEPGANDHQKLATGASLLDGNPVFDGVVYLSSHALAGASLDGVGSTRDTTVSRSLDGGATWTPHTALTGDDLGPYRTGGPLQADRESNVHLPVYLCGDADQGLGVTSSNDHGVTWTPVAIHAPGNGCQGLDPGMAIDSEGHAYIAGWGDGRIWVSATQDGGASWTDAVPVSIEALASHVLVDAVAGHAGRVAVAYLATADTDAGPNAAPGYARWHLYVSYTQDALSDDPTWGTVRVTPAGDPVQHGSICTVGIACFAGNRNLLDFIDVQAGPDGRVYVAYTDGCITTEDQTCRDPPSSREKHAMIAVQHEGGGGFRLFEDRAPWASP